MAAQQKKSLTTKGKEFIRKVANNNNLLEGKNRYGLPNSTISNQSITFKSKVANNKTSSQFAEDLILYINQFSSLKNIDANIIAAQMYQESFFKVWNYSPTGALGITQFIPGTISFAINAGFLNNSDRDILLNGVSGNIAGKGNRKQLHQNVIDNPELMIKAQVNLMAYIGERNNNLASSSLFAYNRGSGLRSNNYPEIIRKSTLPIEEGITYVSRIFKSLETNFGYNIDSSVNDVASKGGYLADV
ncbi:MAG: transglycosylase SLT domain-containing protein [bacterium]